MMKKFKNVISVLLAFVLVITSAVCGVAVNDGADSAEESTTVVENTEATEETTTEPSTEEVTTAPSEEETTTEAPSEEEATTEAPSEEETTTEAPSEEETTAEAPSEEDTTTEAPSEEETTTEAPSEEETTTEAPSEEETTTEAPSEEETTTEAPSEEETTTEAPSEEETTTEAPSEEETTTEAPSEEETTTEAPSEEETTTEAPSEEETTTEAPSEEETTEPTDPTDPSQPEDPTDPSQPEDPTDPSQPEDPTDPSEPEDPTDPSEPEEPTDPSQPEEPTDPSEPEEPTEPSEPEEPTDPSQPEDPTDPSEPEEPTDPSEPEVPEVIVPANVDLTLISGKNGVVLSWADAFEFLGDDYAYAVGYRIYRKTADSNWKRIATVGDANEYVDIKAVYGETYYYVIRAFYNTAEGEVIIGGYDEAGFEISPKYVITPEITEVSLQKNRYIKIVWTSIPGATKYALYRATSPDGKFTKIYVGSIRKFADKTATPGETYYYKVKAYTDDKGSSASELASYQYKVAAPVIKGNLASNENSVKLEWSKVKGADGYKIYRKSNSGDSWTLIKTIKNGDTTSYVNKNLNGRYYFAVRAYYKDGEKTVNGALSETIKARTLAKVKTVKVTTDKENYTNTIKWSKVSGATGYQLYAKVAGGEWEHIVTTEAGIRAFTHLVSANTIHYYKVRAVYASTVSAFSDTVKSDINIIPSFTVSLPSNKISKPEYITVKIKNNTKKEMVIYAAGATYAYGEDTYTLIMSNSTKESFVENVKIPSGKTVTVYMFPYDYVDSYRKDGAVGFLLETNNDIFVVASSVVYGTQAYYYGSTK